MSETKWTPGPWENRHNACVYADELIAQCEGSTHEQAAANAHLISAAPTMAEYINKMAIAGDAEAQSIMDQINAKI